MISQLLAAIAAYIPRDRVEHILHPGLAEASDGVALIADMSGFTPLTEALAAGLSPDQGAEELTRALDTIFTPLVRAIHKYGGSVLKFSGDALIVAYPRMARTPRATTIRRAIASAFEMQRAMQTYGVVRTPLGPVMLRMKIGFVFGPFRRFTLGLPEYGFEDTLIGATLDHMAEAEHHAEPGEILSNPATLAFVAGDVVTGEQRGDFVVLHALTKHARPHPWPAFDWGSQAVAELTTRLTPYIPAPIARTLAAGRTQVAELKPVVSMFVQFHGLDYDHDPQIVDRLQTYFSAAQQIAERYGGRVNRLITGDKGSLLHVLFGAPISEENQEERALRCALDLQRECGGLPFVSMQRIGIAAGRVFAGPVGAPERHDYTTIGDAINLSARLMQNAADHQILLQTSLAQSAGDAFEFADLGTIRVKGKSEPIPVMALNAVRPTRRVLRAAPTIYGRDPEVALVGNQVQQLALGQGSLVVLSGELGLGKTLLLEVVRSTSPATLTWLSGTCMAYGQQLSGYLVIDTLRDLLGLAEGSPAEAIRERLRVVCRDLFGEAQVASTFPYLARFMGLPLGNEARRLEGLAGEALRWRMFEVLRELFRRAALQTPIVLAFDDLQWSDPTSLDLIEQLAPLTQEVPLLLIAAMRPEATTAAWVLRTHLISHYQQQCIAIELAAFGVEQATSLVQQLDARIPLDFAQRLGEHGGGNPLFLVELVRALEIRGLLANPAQLSDASIQTLGLPDSVQSLLLAQIDRLVVEARHVLQIAAVIGPSFLEQVLSAIAAGERDLDQRLRDLTGEQFIQPEDGIGSAYRFRHMLVQQSAYSTLLYERRRAYHREVAEALERLFPSQIVEQAGLLGYHYERAELFDRAISFQLQAADSARLLAANQEAEALYRRVLELIDKQVASGIAEEPARRARILLKLAQVRSNQLDFSGAQELYDQAFALLEQGEQSLATSTRSTSAPREIRIGVFEHGPSTLDPGQLMTAGDGEIIKDLFEGLVELDTDLNIVPACARRWQVSDDGLLYQFELRPGLRWSDGNPLTARDFVFAWRRNLDPITGSWLSSMLFGVDGAEAYRAGTNRNPDSIGIEALDDTTLHIRLNHQLTSLLYLLYDPITYPQPSYNVMQHGALAFEPAQHVCNGAFRVAESQAQRVITLAHNPWYQGFANGNLDRIELRYVAPRYENYRNGEIDLCRIEDQAYSQSELATQPLLLQYLSTYFLAFAAGVQPFDSIAVRQAFAAAIDQQDLVETVWENVQKPANGGVIPPGMTGHSPECGIPFSPGAARATIAMLGGTQSLPAITLAAIPGMAGLPAYLAEQWRMHLGVEIAIVVDVAFEDIVTGMQNGTYQLALVGCDAEYPDAGYFLSGFRPGEVFTPGWNGPQFEALLTEIAHVSDQRQRIAYCHAADRLLVEQETIIVPLYYYQAYGLLRPEYQFASDATIIRGGTIPLKHLRMVS